MTHEPEIHTCRMGCESLLGEAANTTSGNGSAACYDTQDGHVNFPIDHIFFEFSFLFELPAPVPESIPGYNDYAESELFGIIAADVTTLKYLANGEIYWCIIMVIVHCRCKILYTCTRTCTFIYTTYIYCIPIMFVWIRNNHWIGEEWFEREWQYWELQLGFQSWKTRSRKHDHLSLERGLWNTTWRLERWRKVSIHVIAS